MERGGDHLNPFLLPVADWVRGLSDVDVVDDAGLLRLEEMSITTPIEIDAATSDDGSVDVACGPPTQRIETSIMPVLHRMTLRLTVEE